MVLILNPNPSTVLASLCTVYGVSPTGVQEKRAKAGWVLRSKHPLTTRGPRLRHGSGDAELTPETISSSKGLKHHFQPPKTIFCHQVSDGEERKHQYPGFALRSFSCDPEPSSKIIHFCPQFCCVVVTAEPKLSPLLTHAPGITCFF